MDIIYQDIFHLNAQTLRKPYNFDSLPFHFENFLQQNAKNGMMITAVDNAEEIQICAGGWILKFH